MFKLLLLLGTFLSLTDSPKIVSLMQVRNEEQCIEQCLQALSFYVDAFVTLDDNSEDSTKILVESCCKKLGKEFVILRNEQSGWQVGKESDNKQKLLDAGRALGGTHFVLIDADEMFTANCSDNNFLRKLILSLQPGESMEVCWIQLWRTIDRYRFDDSKWTNDYKPVIFCDDGVSNFPSYFLHNRSFPVQGKRFRLQGYEYGLLHFQFVNWQNLLEKQAWYRCLERIRQPEKSCQEINVRYFPSKDERGLRTQPSPVYWFKGYEFLDFSVWDKPILWRKKQVLAWFEQYGKGYFKDLDIWDIDWSF
ncbi:MAG: hypothetical protein AB7R69_01135 [Candidatus Babeliales bacterium]